MKKIMVFGSINADLTVLVKDFPKPGETILGKQHHWFPGGKGANQAVAICRLGGDVCLVGKIGDDHLGRTVIDTLHHENINTVHVTSVKDISTGLALIQVNAQGQNTIVVSPGANQIWPESDAMIDSLLEGYDVAVLQLEIPISTVGKIMERAKRMDLYTVLNAAPAHKDIIPFLSNVDLLVVNETEAALLSDEAVLNSTNIRGALNRLAGLGAGDIIITRGENGSLVYTGNNYYSIPAYNVEVVDTTAAGDTFVGALVTCLSNNDGIIEATRRANAAGALTVTKLGAQSSIPTKQEVDEFIKIATNSGKP